MASYELPSMYSRKPEGYVDSEDEEVSIMDNNGYNNPIVPPASTMPLRSNYRDIHVEDNRLAWLLCSSAFSILILTVIPVLAKLPDISPWFSGNTLWRFFDPLITLPLNLFIITRADIMYNGRSNYLGPLSESSVAWLFWSFGAAIYVQFHGVHAAAALFKHPVKDFNLSHPELVQQYPILQEIYSNMRDLWEHYIAHYLYAAGAMIMSWVQLFAFRNQIHGPLSTSTKIVWSCGIVFYGLLLAGVAIEFPQGSIVGLVYSVIMIIVCVSMVVFNKKNLKKGGLFTMGRRMVLQFYLWASVIGLVIVVIWVGIYGFSNRLEAGVNT